MLLMNCECQLSAIKMLTKNFFKTTINVILITFVNFFHKLNACLAYKFYLSVVAIIIVGK